MAQEACKDLSGALQSGSTRNFRRPVSKPLPSALGWQTSVHSPLRYVLTSCATRQSQRCVAVGTVLDLGFAE